MYRGTTKIADVTTGLSTPAYTDSGLTSGANYNYSIVAFDTSGNLSQASAVSTLATKADDMSPTTPLGVTAAAPDSVSVNVAWNPSADFPNPGGVGVAGYKIYRNNATTATYTVTNGTSYVDTNVTPDTTYTYTVTAYDLLGNESAPSNIASAKTQAVTPSCTANPSTPGSLTSGASTLTTTQLSWSASSAGAGCTLAGYRVYRDSAFVGSTPNTNFTDTGLAANTMYNYTVQAYDTNGHVSDLSVAKTIATLADTTAPQAPTGVTATVVSSSKVDLAWAAATDDVAVTNYKIYRSGTLLGTIAGTARSYSDTTVSDDTDYSYSVSAVDAAGNESTKAAATPATVHTPQSSDASAPTVPTNLRTTLVTSRSIAIAWNASSDNVGVAGYHVYRDGAFVGDSTGLSFADTGLNPNSDYTYTVRAFDAAGNTSAASAELEAGTLIPILSSVGDLDGDDDVDLNDLSTLLSHWREVNVPLRHGDIDQDGEVGIFDLSILLSHLGEKV